MECLGWEVEKVGKSYVYIRKFPFIGSFIKIQRIKSPIPFAEIEKIRKKYRAYKVQVAPDIKGINIKFEQQFLKYGYKIDNSPNIPTKTIHINLSQSEKELFNNFSEAKRRAVRRAIKNGVFVRRSDDISAFIKIRTHNLFPMGFLVKKEVKCLWETFYPKNAFLLLAFNRENYPIAGVLLLYFNNIIYYWYASSTMEGKKLFAPTLLVWEALKVAKKLGCRVFDFEGVYDERFPRATSSWKGFTKFKEGFGGKMVEFAPNFYK